MNDNITACIDESVYAEAVCDAAVWAAGRLQAPLRFVHAIDRSRQRAEGDMTGRIGLGTREHLLDELAQIDEQRARVAREHGRAMLAAAAQRAESEGVAAAETCQRHGPLVETLVDLADSIRLLVLGKRGETAPAHDHLGSNLERVIRSLHCPILVSRQRFTAPERILVAFDASATAKRMVARIADSPLFENVECHVVCIGEADKRRERELEAARARLAQRCTAVTATCLSGEVEAALHDYQQQHALDMLVMGAYGHSRIRQLLVGSTTTQMIRHSHSPVLIMR